LSTLPESEQKQRRNIRRQRNLVAKHNYNRGAVHKTATTYRRRDKHAPEWAAEASKRGL